MFKTNFHFGATSVINVTEPINGFLALRQWRKTFGERICDKSDVTVWSKELGQRKHSYGALLLHLGKLAWVENKEEFLKRLNEQSLVMTNDLNKADAMVQAWKQKICNELEAKPENQ